MSIIEDIQQKIDQAKKNQERIDLEVQETGNRLDEKRAEQTNAILDGKPTAAIEKEIISLQTKYTGLLQARDKQVDISKGLQEDEKAEQKNLKEAETNAIQNEMLNLYAAIYERMVACIPIFNELHEKQKAYFAILHHAPTIYGLHPVDTAKELLEVMSHFPREIFTGSELPKPDDVRRTCK
jgi:hypothetical protein